MYFESVFLLYCTINSNRGIFLVYMICVNYIFGLNLSREKSRIWETEHLSTDADSSTDAIGG